MSSSPTRINGTHWSGIRARARRSTLPALPDRLTCPFFLKNRFERDEPMRRDVLALPTAESGPEFACTSFAHEFDLERDCKIDRYRRALIKGEFNLASNGLDDRAGSESGLIEWKLNGLALDLSRAGESIVLARVVLVGVVVV